MRQFIVEKNQIKNSLIQLEGKDYRYFRQVLRVRAGDMVSVRLPDGNLSNATVAKIDEASRCLTLQLCAETGKTITRGVQAEELTGDNASVNGALMVEYWLFQFLPRPQKFEQIVKQATECGVSVIVPVIGEYTEKSSAEALRGSKKERLERIIKEARQQSGSPVNTRVTEPMSLEQAIEFWGSGDVAFVLSERDDCSGNLRSSVQAAGGLEQIKKAAIAVGSEGGISPDEVRLLEEKGLFVPIHFAVNILRCETAALYGIAAVQSEINQSKGLPGQAGQ
jgi:16S rRNA (uracil1498-N3)-methyltransferase